MKVKWLFTSLLALVVGLGWSLALADHVRLRPLGTVTGKLCKRDRAILFVDHDGTTILYDAGRSVEGSGDARLPDLTPDKLDGVLLTSVHSDHIGDFYVETDTTTGTLDQACADPEGFGTVVGTTPNSNTAEIASVHDSKVPVGGEMSSFLAKKLTDVGATTAAAQTLRMGGERTVGSVKISVVQALHSNGIPRSFLTDPHKTDLNDDKLTAYVGPDNGYILTFENGLVVYISGDTGPTSDMKNVVRVFYGAHVGIIHLGGTFSNTPTAAAFAICNLIQPKTAIPEHVNTASTPTTLADNVQSFVDQVCSGRRGRHSRRGRSIDVIVPFSWDKDTGDFEITCDGNGNCTQQLP